MFLSVVDWVLAVIVGCKTPLCAIWVVQQVVWSFETARIPKRAVMIPSETYPMAKPVMTLGTESKNRVVLAFVVKPVVFSNIGMWLMIVKSILSVTFAQRMVIMNPVVAGRSVDVKKCE